MCECVCRYDGGSTYTGLGLTGMTTVSFSTEAGHRTGVPKVGIVVTDGQSSSSSNTVAAAKKAKSAGIVIFVSFMKFKNKLNTKMLISKSSAAFCFTPAYKSHF